MKQDGFPRGYKVYLPLAFVFTVLLLLMPRSGNFKYSYKKGTPWLYETLIAQFDFPILKTAAQLQEERNAAGSGVIPYYKYSEEAVASAMRAAEFADFGEYDRLRPEIRRILSGIYASGVVSEFDETAGGVGNVIYIQKDKRASKYPSDEIYRLSEARAAAAAGISALVPGIDADSLCRTCGIWDMISPNLEFDQQTTDLVHDEAVNYISPTSGVIYSGQLIVSNGEIVTAEIEQLLDSYKAEYDLSYGYTGPVFLLWAGNAALALLLTVILFFAIYYSNPDIFGDLGRYLYILLVALLAAVAALVTERTGHQHMYLVPFTLTALYLVAFFRRRVVFAVYTVSLLPLLIFAHDGPELFVMYLFAGVVAIFSFRFFNRGWQQFITAFFVFLSLLVTYFTFRLVKGAGYNDYQTMLFMGLGSLFSIAGYPLIFLFERVYGLVSDTRLIELSDTNNKLLRNLADSAPGTFQHSLQVMNMADAAARAIGANVNLVRCGALYHDIGKIPNPLCFIENETAGTNYHAKLTPAESARDIIRHVADGYAIAEKAGLPDIVKDFIVTHHGTTCTAYFYEKFIAAGGNPDEAGDFYYKGRKPTTKEHIILMLCDTLEAASRSLRDFSSQSVSDFVDRLFNAKMQDGQFDEADISLRELGIMKAVLKEHIGRVHHARVVYPKRQSGLKRQL